MKFQQNISKIMSRSGKSQAPAQATKPGSTFAVQLASKILHRSGASHRVTRYSWKARE
jgi:hypothetical protein